MINKLISKNNITEFEQKVKARLKDNQLIFNNKIQLTELKILDIIDNLKYNESYFLSCYIA